jgi:aminopeptidase N
MRPAVTGRRSLRAGPGRRLAALLVGGSGAVAQPVELPGDELLRLLEEGAHLEAAGKSASAPGAPGPAAEAPHAWDALHYRLDVTPSRTARHVEGTVTVTLVVREPGLTHVDLDAVGMTFSSVRVGGASRATWTSEGGRLLVPICEGASCPPHAPGDTLVVEVAYACDPVTGFYHFARNSYTSVEPDQARHWWPCWDRPSDKATLDLLATVPDSNSCWSNGVLVGVTPAAPGFSTWHWRESHPIATYLVSVAVARYGRFDQEALGVPIVNVAFPEDSTRARAEYLHVPAMLEVFSAEWAPYPFDKYGQATVEPYGVGGMEHQTMSTLWRGLLRGDRRYEYVWAHELAHQWWGDWVTCVDFRDIWLNEGFASFAEALWVERFYAGAAYDSAIGQAMGAALAADAGFRYALYDPPPGYTFGTTIYKKGASVLHMLRRIVGDDAFRDGFRLYGERFGYGTATTRDFQQAMEDASGQALAWFFDPWIFAAGIPTYAWSWQAVAAADPPAPGWSDVVLHVRQVQAAAPRFRMPLEFAIERSGGPDTTVMVWNEAVAEQQIVVRVEGAVTGVTFDPRQSVLKRVEPATVDAASANPPERGWIALTVTPNPARGAVALGGAWTGAAGGAGPATARFLVFDAAGRLVRDLGTIERAAGGSFTVTWDRADAQGRPVAPGIYFAQVLAGEQREARPVVLVP